MSSFVFMVIRHVNSEITNNYWQECYRSIRKWYPSNLIVFVDDYSLTEFVKDDRNTSYQNTFVIQSDCPKGCGEFLGYYYFYKHNLADFAIVLHDSFWIQKPIPGLESFINTPESKVKTLLHFNTTWNHHSFSDEIDIINKLKNAEELVVYFHQLEICNLGFFGIQSCISYSFLETLQHQFQIMDILHHVTTRDKRMCLERVFGAVCSFIFPALLEDPSFYGDVIENYIHKYEHTGYSFYLENREKILLEDRPFIKIFSGR